MPSFRKCATFFVALFFFSPFVYPDSKQSVPREVVRFIYKYYYNVPNRDLLNAIDQELLSTYPTLDISSISSYAYDKSIDGPGNLVRFIESQIQSQGSTAIRDPEEDGISTENMADWMQYASECDLYLLYASDSGSKAESSFGHISLLYKSPNNPYFSRIVTFLASDFIDQRTGKKSAAKYFKGAFGVINGSMRAYPFFDELRSSILDDSRIIALYKICVDDAARNRIDRSVWNDLHQQYSYNFFIHNCSTHIFDLLADACRIDAFQTKCMPPAINVRRLCRKKILQYSGSYVRTSIDKGVYGIDFKDDPVYDLSRTVHYQTATLSLNKESADFDFSFFHFNRPFNGMAYQSSNVTIGTVALDYSSEGISLQKISPLKIEVSPQIFGGVGVLYRIDAGYNGGAFLQQEAGLFVHYGALRVEGGYNYGLGHEVVHDIAIRSIVSMHRFDAGIDVAYQDERLLFDSVYCRIFPVSDASIMLRVGPKKCSIGFSFYN